MADEFIAKMANQTGDNTSQIGREGEDFNILPVLLQEDLEIWNCRQKTFKRTANGGFIVGHDDYSYVGSTFDTYVGSVSPTNPQTYELSAVQNAHNLFYEGFYNDRFISTGSSTGSWLTGSDWYQTDYNEALITDYVAMEDKIYKSVTLTLNSRFESGSDALATYSAWAGISGSWYSLDINNTTVIPNVSNEGMKIQIKNTGIGGDENVVFGETGLPFPIVLGTPVETEKSFITNFTVKYSE